MLKKLSILGGIIVGTAAVLAHIISFQRSCEPFSMGQCIYQWVTWATSKQHDAEAAAKHQKAQQAKEEAREAAAFAKAKADQAEAKAREDKAKSDEAARQRDLIHQTEAKRQADLQAQEEAARKLAAALAAEKAENERKAKAEHDRKLAAEKALSHAKQQIQGLEIAVTSVQVFRDEIRVALKLANQDPIRPMALACYAQGSDGIADFWKFMPQPDAVLTDEVGGKYSLRFQSPCFGYGRDGKDWTGIGAGKSIDAILSFDRASHGVGTQFALSLSVRISLGQTSGTTAQFGTPFRAAVVIREIPSFQDGPSGGPRGLARCEASGCDQGYS